MTKINFSSSGKKEHFYKLDNENQAILVYVSKGAKEHKTIPINTIKRFGYGVTSENLKKKFKSIKNTQLKNPWLFFSIITNQRSIDLYLEPDKLNNWFYGISYYLKNHKQEYKIINTSRFVLTKMKLKLINQLKDYYSITRPQDNDEYKDLVNAIIQGKI